jgi:hypothetical protein
MHRSFAPFGWRLTALRMTTLSGFGTLRTQPECNDCRDAIVTLKNESVVAEKEYMQPGLFVLISKHEILSQLQMRRLWPSGVHAIDALRILPVGSQASADVERDG